MEALTPDSAREKKKAHDESVPTEDDDIGSNKNSRLARFA